MANVTIRQTWSYDGNNDQARETVTDEEGRFYFEKMDEPRKFRGPFKPFIVPQELAAIIDGKVVELWGGVKYYPEENSEYMGFDFDVICDIRNPYTRRSGQRTIRTLCVNVGD